VQLVVIVLTAFTALISAEFDFTDHIGEYFGLLLLGAIGMLFLVAAENLVMIFAALEATLRQYFIQPTLLQQNPTLAMFCTDSTVLKDRAENIMIVDLERNDLGRVCRYGTVNVSELCTLEKYPTVFQLTSCIEGRLAEGRSRIDLLEGCFPGGSITGAPKIRAMEIIDELENVRRGPYAGCVGYFSFSGNMDTCITIRTIVIKNNTAYIGVV
jgi:hypothetical protein